jgi:hypothetical protein
MKIELRETLLICQKKLDGYAVFFRQVSPCKFLGSTSFLTKSEIVLNPSGQNHF